MPTPVMVPEADGEARRRRAGGSGGDERKNRWFVLEKGEKRGKVERKGSEIAIACYNIRDGRNGGLLSAARALDHANVDVAFLQEVKLKDPKFASKTGYGYSIVSMAAGTTMCGGGGVIAGAKD